MEINLEDGYILPIDKPYGWTSADVVRKVKYWAKQYTRKKNIKVGHAGTLDPLATGLLLVCIGKATKQAEALQAEQKEYIAEICFGATTPSYDLETSIDAQYPYEHITPDLLTKALDAYTGPIDQIPPVFSAKLIDGKRAYEYARSGEAVEMRPSHVTVYQMDIISFELPKVVIKVVCSKGTYIRSLARDLGIETGSGAHLTNLRRTVSGRYDVNDASAVDNFANYIHNNPPSDV